MISYAEVRVAEWILKKCCTQNLEGCRTCPHASRCTAWGHEAIPEEWDIPEPPEEPAERPRIEWLRMLATKHLRSTTHISWWIEKVTLEQFRKDVGLDD